VQSPLRAPSLGASADMPAAPFEERVGAADAEPAASNGAERVKLQSVLQRRIMAELGFSDPIDPDRPLNEAGLDSLRSVALSNGLEKDFGIPVSVAVLIKGPTINQLVDYLVDQFAGTQPGGSSEPRPATTSSVAVGTPAANPARAVADVHEQAAPGAHESSASWTSEARVAGDRFHHGPALRQVTNRSAIGEAATKIARNAIPDGGRYAATASANGGNGVGTDDFFDRPVPRPAGGDAARAVGKWLIAPLPNPDAKARLFCFPFAGGGLVSFRSWPPLLDHSVEMVAVEPPGRGTRINETAVDDLDTFVERLLPEMIDWLDRPSAFFGHCVGGLTMVATVRALPEASERFIKYMFACGVKPPHLLKRRGAFEDNLAYEMMLHRDFDSRIPPYAQTDEIFADIIRRFDTPGSDRFLATPKLRQALLPTIRAEFGMAYNYSDRPGAPFSFPIASFVGDADPWVSAKDSAAWGELTRGRFTNHLRKGSHFLMADDREYILQTINKEFANFVPQ
jgi:surfactin synthase thioesterase subunit/acyl carrier protein